MFHRLFAGFFDEDAVISKRLLLIKRPLNKEIVMAVAREHDFQGDGYRFQVGKDELTIEDGYVDCPWLTPRVNKPAVQFMLRLSEVTGCMFADLGHGEIVDEQVLLESLG